MFYCSVLNEQVLFRSQSRPGATLYSGWLKQVTFAFSACDRILVSSAQRTIGFAANASKDSKLALRGGSGDFCEAAAADSACSTRPLAICCTIAINSVVGEKEHALGVALLGRALFDHLREGRKHVKIVTFGIHA